MRLGERGLTEDVRTPTTVPIDPTEGSMQEKKNQS